ncbi:acetyl-CoA C-acyltransferase [Streptomyces sp. NPDC020802]|uniref:acetyl-CoA C-acyltransferase n=1 Tax=Streptomyces sp. NPDC020802 TaxID=3365094 RepID=UPI0037BA5E53
MSDVYLYDAIRTGRGKAKAGGGLAHRTPLQLLSTLLADLGRRHDLPSGAIADLVIGAATQTGAQGGNLARTAAILAGWHRTPGMMLNRFCASGIDAINTAAARTRLGTDGLVVAGGVESVSHAPMYSDHGPLFEDPDIAVRAGSVAMGIAADLIATMEGFDRAELDAFGARSQQRAHGAWQAGRFAADVVDVPGLDGEVFATDEAIRAHATADSLAQLEPAFAKLGASGQDDLVRRHHPEIGEIRHLHTVGTSPTLVDAAAITLIGSARAGAEYGLRPRARIVSAASVAVDPVVMLTGGQEAVERALEQAGLHPDEIAVFEFAESFAATCLKFQRDLTIDDDRFNPNGGTIAMGHAFGATGAILAANCVGELERRGERYGVIAVSGAAGLGSATVLERSA